MLRARLGGSGLDALVTEPVNQRHDIGSVPRGHFQGSAGEYVVPQAWLDPACNGAQLHPTKAGILQEHVGGDQPLIRGDRIVVGKQRHMKNQVDRNGTGAKRRIKRR